ncbi:MAG: YihA family ribosome biogenesis GTP-binding protein [Betaproteobacteria bacterium]|nr:YihA family ribosome biogenesis GTP-binding protein [Betaproteobacteria bacterium]
MSATYLDVEFAFGAAKLEQLPPDEGPEVAFAGRSNSGKSTAINALCNRKRLAFVSKTPGRTQQINFYRVATGGFLVDLPGYGYAKVAGSLRSTWGKLLGTYVTERRPLRGIVVMMDSRRPFTDLDLQLLEWIQQSPRPVHMLLTKADKLNRQECNRLLNQARDQLAAMPGFHTVQLFSGASKLGVEEARAKVLQWLLPVSEPAEMGSPGVIES